MRNLLFLSFFIIGLISCNDSKKQANIDIIEKVSNSKIQIDDFLWVNYLIKTAPNDTLFSNYDHTIFRNASEFKGDFFESLGKLSEGDSAIIKVSVDSLKKYEHPVPSSVKGGYLFYYLRIKKVVSRIGKPSRVSDSVLNASIIALRTETAQYAKKKEEAILKQYIIRNHLKPSTTQTGLNYIIHKIGKGTKPQPGDLCEVSLTIRFTDGRLFYTTDEEQARLAGYLDPKKYGLAEMYIGKHYFIQGIEEGLMLLPKGTKATLIIPSKLSNGERYGYAPLVCEVEVFNVRHPKPNEKIKMLHEDAEEMEKIQK